MKKFAITFFILLFFAGQAFGAELVASKNGSKYHMPDCKLARRIKADNIMKFRTAEEAVKAGYKPCKRCNPPAPEDRHR